MDMPGLGQQVVGPQARDKVEAGAGMVIGRTVVVIVQLGIAPGGDELRPQRQPAALPFVHPKAGAKLAAPRALAHVVQQLDVRLTPGEPPAQADAGIESRLAHVEAGRALRAPILREAYEAVGDERVDAPVARPELQADVRSVQIGAFALVEVQRKLVGAALGAGVGRTLPAQEIAEGSAAGGERIGERVALRMDAAGSHRGGEAEHEARQEARGVDWAHRRHGMSPYSYARLS